LPQEREEEGKDTIIQKVSCQLLNFFGESSTEHKCLSLRNWSHIYYLDKLYCEAKGRGVRGEERGRGEGEERREWRKGGGGGRVRGIKRERGKKGRE